jgi:hypothetical protein
VHLVRWQPLEVVLVAVQLTVTHQVLMVEMAAQVVAHQVTDQDRSVEQELQDRETEVAITEVRITPAVAADPRPQALTVQAHRMVVPVY